ncbi:DUF3306 domain-containing protein [Pseudorhodoferax sp. Leaf274]|uniref:DUF3306 domain-containing protein n=1 Tax=Pseudorhodoferax sp. Leaf274 TaxID=1736318 RepID=UPI000702BD08|nr:DUF3306 domain-containing protein [Pseudorhodoferax sp. Leaf274]KQP45123.1 hypothetical protein ASF44_27000 [Pseudorhodoferax sp. Leaf274]
MAQDSGFLSRWSRRKVQARQDAVPADAPVPVPAAVPVVSAGAQPAPAEAPAERAAPPLPTLDDVTQLTRDSDFSRFVAPEVSGEVRNAALKKLFSDPHFNVMDGLDTYIDDYNKPDPLPAAMLRQMAQAAYLGLVQPEPQAEQAGTPAAATEPHDEDPDLRLQSHHDPGPPGAEPGAGGDARGQC